MLSTQIPLYTYSRLKGKTNNGGGSGWTVEGKEFFDNLQHLVKADREKHANANQAGSAETITFNKELYQSYQQRRENERDDRNGGNHDKQLKQKKPAYQCVDEFDDDDSDDNLIDSEQLTGYAET
jgi:hypothetical protein